MYCSTPYQAVNRSCYRISQWSYNVIRSVQKHIKKLIKQKRSVVTRFGRHGMPPPAANDRYSIGPRRLRLITWPCDHDLRLWRSWRLRVVIFHPYTKFEVRRPCHSEDIVDDVCHHWWAWWPSSLTVKLVCEAHQRWRTLIRIWAC